MKRPFEAHPRELEAELENFVDQVFADLESDFLVMPKGRGFVDYRQFEDAYRALYRATGQFRRMEPDAVLDCVVKHPLVFVVLRAILGMTPSEWAYLASRRSHTDISQQAARRLDRDVRLGQGKPLAMSQTRKQRLRALIQTACELLAGEYHSTADTLHRLDKADTCQGTTSLQACARLGMPYAMVLYERFLGRPFASHRDSVSELIADALEGSIERILEQAGVIFRKTRRAEQLPGFDQAPDFVIPDEFNPKVIIEAKITEDDGTARDKVTRIQHLASLARQKAESEAEPRFQVVACIAGRGFGVRREDMRKLLRATGGKVFTPRTLRYLIPCTRLREFAHQADGN